MGMAARLIKAERVLNGFSDWIGRLSAVLLLVLLLNVFYDVVMRYLFNDVSIGMQELEWHLYAAIFLLGVAYTLKVDGHVRVDLVYERLSPRRRALIDIIGTVVLLWPFCLLVAGYGIGFAHEAYAIGETSGDPGGLPYRWVIKGMIPLAFCCVIISSIGFMLRSLNEYLGLQRAHDYDSFKR
jgi:TRAP-type mannitol/chloroaromatic compound transport system permease small subunit